jgi:hypothetical protein
MGFQEPFFQTNTLKNPGKKWKHYAWDETKALIFLGKTNKYLKQRQKTIKNYSN